MKHWGMTVWPTKMAREAARMSWTVGDVHQKVLPKNSWHLLGMSARQKRQKWDPCADQLRFTTDFGFSKLSTFQRHQCTGLVTNLYTQAYSYISSVILKVDHMQVQRTGCLLVRRHVGFLGSSIWMIALGTCLHLHGQWVQSMDQSILWWNARPSDPLPQIHFLIRDSSPTCLLTFPDLPWIS